MRDAALKLDEREHRFRTELLACSAFRGRLCVGRLRGTTVYKRKHQPRWSVQYTYICYLQHP